jgi:hypothetical protein
VSLFSNSTSGIFGFFSNLSNSAGQLGLGLTLDENFQRHHLEKQTAQQRHYERWRRKGCGNIALIVTRPVHDIVFGVLSASTGLLTEPYRGARKNGIVGFTRGVGVGVLGLVVKPVVGLFDAISHLTGSMDDIARSVNLLDVKFKPIERYRHPYYFGVARMLLPFNQVQSRSAQLLLAYPLDKKARISDEVIVTSQALHMGPASDQYIIVTTKRVVLFRLKDYDGTGFITVNLEWQARFEKGFKISSSIGSRGHNGTILFVNKSSSANKGDEVSLSSSEATGELFNASDSFLDFDRPNSISETPKSKAFRLRGSRLFASTDSEVIQRFIVEGNFGQRLQLSQIHNAICCLNGDFDSLIYEGRRGRGDDGITSFGHLTFGQRDKFVKSKSEDPDLLFSLLENLTWQYSMSATHGDYSAPAWILNAWQRAMLAPPPEPLLPYIDSNDEFVLTSPDGFECGLKSPESREQEINAHAKSPKSPNFNSTEQENNYFTFSGCFSRGSGSILESCEPGNEREETQTLTSPGCSPDIAPPAANPVFILDELHPQEIISDATITSPTHPDGHTVTSRDNYSHEQDHTVESPTSLVIEPTHIGHSHLDDHTVTSKGDYIHSDGHTERSHFDHALDARLRRVEVMLEQFISNPSPNVPDTDQGHDGDGPAAENNVSSTDPTPKQAHATEETSEVDALKREISDLKRQLAAKKEANRQSEAAGSTNKKAKKYRVKFFKKE